MTTCSSSTLPGCISQQLEPSAPVLICPVPAVSVFAPDRLREQFGTNLKIYLD